MAVKYLSPRLLAAPGFVAAFRSEATLLRALDVRQVVRIFDYVEAPGQGAAIIMELVDGVSLHKTITARGPASAEPLRPLIARGMAKDPQPAHDRGRPDDRAGSHGSRRLWRGLGDSGSVLGVSCASTSFCVAVCSYVSSRGDQGQGLLLTWRDGSWTSATAPRPLSLLGRVTRAGPQCRGSRRHARTSPARLFRRARHA